MPTLEIWSTESDTSVGYTIHGHGRIEKYDDPDDEKLAAESGNDSLHTFPDGSYVLVGSTGNTYGDAYTVEQQPYTFVQHSGDGGVEVVYDGDDVTGQLTRFDPSNAADLLDRLRRAVGSGYGNGGGSGNADAGSTTDDSPSTDTSTDDSAATDGHCYGGGACYPDTVTMADADYVATTLEGARGALSQASSGDVVFIPGGNELYSSSKDSRLVVTDGVTLASDRGVDGSPGALVHTDAAYSYGAEGLVSVRGDDARVTGLRIRGPHPDPAGGWREHSYDYEMSGINARYHGAAGLEVDNCEVWGFAHGVAAGTDSHVHHNHLHDANMKGLGYCASFGDTEGGIFEWNYCQHWRHVVAAGGGGGYEARYNLIDGPCISHAFDQHSPGGTYTRLHHNTMRVAVPVTGDPRVPFATFRGENVRNAEVWNNWVYNDWEATEVCEGWPDEWLTHAKAGATCFDGIEYWDNHLGADEPGDDAIGAPRPYN